LTFIDFHGYFYVLSPFVKYYDSVTFTGDLFFMSKNSGGILIIFKWVYKFWVTLFSVCNYLKATKSRFLCYLIQLVHVLYYLAVSRFNNTMLI